jgi:ketosteroid isomerase-like protein
MRNLAVFFVLAISCLGFGQGENAQLRKEVTQLYAAFDRAVNTADFNAAFALMDPSFVAVDENGKSMTYKEFKTMVNSMKGVMKDMRSHITVQQVQGNSNEAFVWLTMRHSFSMKEGKTWKKYDMTEKFVETLKKTPSGWKITYSQMQPKA